MTRSNPLTRENVLVDLGGHNKNRSAVVAGAIIGLG
jgi:hypothetical protein